MQENSQTIIPNKVFESEIEEKKSKFITYAKYVQSKSEVDNFISDITAKHPKARHICYAYRIIENGQVYQKSNDDGEPSGTAGKPILNIIEKNELYNVCIVVVRYFGGIKLGAGNLLRMYSNSAKECLKDSVVNFSLVNMLLVKVSYLYYTKVISLFSQNNIVYNLIQENENAVFEIVPDLKDRVHSLLSNCDIAFTAEIIKKIKINS